MPLLLLLLLLQKVDALILIVLIDDGDENIRSHANLPRCADVHLHVVQMPCNVNFIGDKLIFFHSKKRFKMSLSLLL